MPAFGERAVSLHASQHEDGGSDEVDVGGLSGVLADKQDADKLQGRDVGSGAPSDGDALVYSSGSSAWAPLAVARWEVVHDETLASTDREIDITGLDINSDGFYKLIMQLHNPTGSGAHIYAYINNDTTNTNYYYEGLWVRSGTVSCWNGNLPLIVNYDANLSMVGEYTIQRDPQGYARIWGYVTRNSGSSVDWAQYAQCKTATVSNITQLTLYSTVVASYAAGCRFILLKPPL